MKKRIDICFSPGAYQYCAMDKSITIIIDIFRASSTICTALHNEAEHIKPCLNREEALALKEKGYITAGERNGDKLVDFDLGNSPFDYMNDNIKGKKIGLTTTNGTYAIDVAKKSEQIIIASFLNINAVVDYVIKQNKNVVLLCAGWKNRINYEDTIFAGILADKLKSGNYTPTSDSIGLAKTIYDAAKNDMYQYIVKNSIRIQNKLYKLDKDIRYCLQQDIINIVPILKGNIIIK